ARRPAGVTLEQRRPRRPPRAPGATAMNETQSTPRGVSRSLDELAEGIRRELGLPLPNPRHPAYGLNASPAADGDRPVLKRDQVTAALRPVAGREAREEAQREARAAERTREIAWWQRGGLSLAAATVEVDNGRRRCAECNGPLHLTRSTKRYCSTRCRV